MFVTLRNRKCTEYQSVFIRLMYCSYCLDIIFADISKETLIDTFSGYFTKC